MSVRAALSEIIEFQCYSIYFQKIKRKYNKKSKQIVYWINRGNNAPANCPLRSSDLTAGFLWIKQMVYFRF